MKDFGLLTPVGLWWLTSLLPILLLYVLKSRSSRLKVSSTFLFRAARKDRVARTPFQRLLPSVPLLFQLLVATLVSIAFAFPVGYGAVRPVKYAVLIVDTSASVATKSGAETRLFYEKEEALRVLGAFDREAEVMVLESGRRPHVLLAFSRDRTGAREAIARLTPREEEGDLEAALRLAAEELRAREGRMRVTVVTDGAVPRPISFAFEHAEVEVLRVPSDRTDNVSLLGVNVSLVRPKGEVEISVLAENASDLPKDVRFSVIVGEESAPRSTDHKVFQPRTRMPRLLRFLALEEDSGKPLRVVLEAEDDPLVLDNTHYDRIPPLSGSRVVFVGDPEGAVHRALTSDADVRVERMTEEAWERGKGMGEVLSVFEGTCPRRLGTGDMLVVAPPEGFCHDVLVSRKEPLGRVTSWEEADARLRFLTLDDLFLEPARSLSTKTSDASLVRAFGKNVVVDAGLPGRNVTVVGMSPSETRWSESMSFVVFVRNVRELAEKRARHHVLTGDPIQVSADSLETELEVVGHEPRRVLVQSAVAILPEVSHAGQVVLRSPWIPTRMVPVNYKSARESDLHDRGMIRISGTPPEEASKRARHPLAFAFVLGALLLLLMDMLWYIARAPVAPGVWRTAFGIALGVGMLALWAGRSHPWLAERIVFARPEILPGAALSLFATAWLLRRSPLVSAKRRGVLSLAVSVSVMGFGVAAAEPSLGRANDALSVWVLVDRSASMQHVPDVQKRVEAELRAAEHSMKPRDQIGVFGFGASPALEIPLHAKGEPEGLLRPVVQRDATNLEEALSLALLEVPPEIPSRIVLLSDGLENQGSVLRPLARAGAAGVPIDTVFLEPRPAKNLRARSLRAPGSIAQGEPLTLRLVLESDDEADVSLRLQKNGIPSREAWIRAGKGETVVAIPDVPSQAELVRYDVEVSAERSVDSFQDDNAASALVRVRGSSQALLLTGDSQASRPIEKALHAAGFGVTVRGPAQVPADPAFYLPYDLVVEGDIPASEFPSAPALEGAVTGLGVGLLLLGGDKSFGPGGYARTPLETLSPVLFDLAESDRRTALSEVIAIDFSGSMAAEVGGRTKLELANEAAIRSMSLLSPKDRLGVAHVDVAVHWTIPMASVVETAKKEAVIRKVKVGGGGIMTETALVAAYGALRTETEGLRHVLLFADGDDAEEISGCPAHVEGARRDLITTSVISLGRGKDTRELEHLAQLGGGRFYLIEDAVRLPAVFAQETVLASKSSILEKEFVPQKGAAPSLAALRSSLPSLYGHVLTRAKPGARVELLSPDGDPVLAHARAGLGQVGVFTSDYSGRWGRKWVASPEASTLMTELLRMLSRMPESPHVRARMWPLPLGLSVLVEDGERAASFRNLVAEIRGPDGFSREVSLDPSGRGQYEARVLGVPRGHYVAGIRDLETHALVATTGAVAVGSEETRPGRGDPALLARVSELSQGKMRPSLAGMFDDRARARTHFVPWSQAPLLVGLLSFVASVALRKWSPSVSRPLRRTPKEPLATKALARTPIVSVSRQADALTAAERLVLRRRERRARPGSPTASS